MKMFYITRILQLEQRSFIKLWKLVLLSVSQNQISSTTCAEREFGRLKIHLTQNPRLIEMMNYCLTFEGQAYFFMIVLERVW